MNEQRPTQIQDIVNAFEVQYEANREKAESASRGLLVLATWLCSFAVGFAAGSHWSAWLRVAVAGAMTLVFVAAVRRLRVLKEARA